LGTKALFRCTDGGLKALFAGVVFLFLPQGLPVDRDRRVALLGGCLDGRLSA
jgi:hypothetical protein